MDDVDKRFLSVVGVVLCVAIVAFSINCRYEEAEKHQQVMAQMQMPEALQQCRSELQKLKGNLRRISDGIEDK